MASHKPYKKKKEIIIIYLLLLINISVSIAAENKDKLSKGTVQKQDIKRLRVLVLDFASSMDKKTSSGLSNIIRNEFANNKNFVTFRIDVVKNLVVPERFKKKGSDFKDFAVYIGKSLRAHKVVIGNVSNDDKSVIVEIKIIDVLSGKVELEKNINISKNEIDIKLQAIAKSITHGILEGRKIDKKYDDDSHGVYSDLSISTGFLKPLGDVSGSLNPSILYTIHFNFNTPFYPWMKLELSGGFSRLKGNGIEDGSARLFFVPVLASLSMKFPVSSNPLVPKPVLIFGGGITYLYLEKEQFGSSISSRGYDPTGFIGLSVYMEPFSRAFIQLENRYHYLHERAAVVYIYGGIRIGAYF